MNFLGSLAEFSVRRWQFTVLMFLMFVALGYSSWRAIPRAEDPDFPVPIFNVVTVYPGATPEDVEQLITEPLERRFHEFDNVKDLKSTSSDGLSFIRVQFEPSVDVDRKYEEVLREVNALRSTLPAGVQRQEVLRSENSDLAVLQLALVSPVLSNSTLDDAARLLEEQVGQVAGVKRVKRWGVPPREMQVTLDLGRLGALSIPVSQLLQALGSDNLQIPGGSVDIGERRFNVSTAGRYRSVEDVERTVIGSSNGAIVRVADVATVSWGDGDAVHIARYNGQRAMFVTVAMKPGQNVMNVRNLVYARLDSLEQQLPAGLTLVRGFDQARNVERRLSRLTTDFAIAIALVMLTLLPLGSRASTIVLISIPLSLAIGITILHAAGYSLNQLSIVGFVIALGLLVDDSVVVVENITRHLREGMSRMQSAIVATRQIGVAVLGATATLILAFLPLMYLPGIPGRYIRSLPMAVIASVVASLVVSLTIIPFLASRLLPATEPAEGNRFLRAFEGGINRTYAPLLHRALGAPWRMLAIAGASVVIAFSLVPTVGFSLFPKAQTPQFHIDIETPDGTALSATDSVVRFVERVLATRPEVTSVFSNVGKGNPMVYYNVFPRAESTNAAQLLVLLDEYHNNGTPAMLDSLRATFDQYPGARIEVKEFENGPPVDAPIAMRIEGQELDSLKSIAARVETVIRETAGTQYVNNPRSAERTDLRLVVDRQKAGLLGVPSSELERTLRMGVAGLEVGKITADNGDEYPLVTRIAHNGRPALEALDRIQLSSMNGSTVPLAQVAHTTFLSSPTSINHHDRNRAVSVTAFVQEGYNTNAVTQQILARLESLQLPAGYRLIPAGEIKARQESFGGIGSAIIIATFGILAILVLEFRDFRTTLVVASVIPLGIVGGIAALLFTGYTLSFTAMIGFVALIGIEIKTSILLVDYTDQLRDEGTPLDEAVQRAGEVRFLPIVLTSLTAIGGLLPLALQGSGLYSPLAWVIIGGLISSTLLARLVTPVLYRMLAPAKDSVSVEELRVTEKLKGAVAA